MNLHRKTPRTREFEAKTRITYVLETNKKVTDTTVVKVCRRRTPSVC
jgi:hypothetical protein